MRLPGLLLLCVLLPMPATASAKDLVVFAAASTVRVLGDVGAAWQAESGTKIRTVYGSSGALARQIAAGAPADVFLSANAAWVEYLARTASVKPATRLQPFGNALVLIAPARAGAAGIIDASIDRTTGTYAALSGNRRLAMADPAHVPAGIYARQSLEHLGIWAATAPRTARTQNVRLALALVESGAAALGIVYRTDALRNPKVTVLQRIPARAHDPVRYTAVATASAKPGTDAFLRFLTGDAATAIYRRHGFVTD